MVYPMHFFAQNRLIFPLYLAFPFVIYSGLGYNLNMQFQKYFKPLAILLTCLFSCSPIFSEGTYISSYGDLTDIDDFPTPRDKVIPIDVKYFIDPDATIACADLNIDEFTEADQDFNPGFYSGVLWINVEFPDTQEDDGRYYNLGFGLKRFNFAEAYRYDPAEDRWISIGRTGTSLDSEKITRLTWIPSIFIDESEFPMEEIHRIRIKMVSYNGSSVSLKLLPSNAFNHDEHVFIILNSFFIGLSVALFLLLIFLGIYIKDRLYVFIGIMTGILYVLTICFRGVGPTNSISLIKNTSPLFIPDYIIILANSLISTLLFLYIIRSEKDKKGNIAVFYTNVSIIAVGLILVVAKIAPKVLYIVVSLGSILCCINLMLLWAINLKKGRRTSYTILDAWALALSAYIIIRTVNFAGTLTGTALKIEDFKFFMPENITFLFMTIPALAITAKRYRLRISILERSVKERENANRILNENLNLRRTVDRLLITSQNSVKNLVWMQQNERRGAADRSSEIILAALDQGINLLSMETILETGNPLESQSINLESTLNYSVEHHEPTAQKKNVHMKLKTSGIENTSISIHPGVLFLFINSMIINSIKLCLENSTMSIQTALDGDTLKMSIDTIADDELRSSVNGFLQNDGKSEELGFTLMKKVLQCYGGTFKAEETESGYRFSFSVKVATENLSSDSVVIKTPYRIEKKATPLPVDSRLAIDGKIPSILFAIGDDASRCLMEDIMNGHCYLYTVSSGDQAFKMLKTAHALGTRLPDIIISDYNLPAVSGMELFRKCSSEDFLRDIPFVFILPPSDADKINSLLALGAIDCITEPYSIERLHRTIFSIYSMTHKIKRTVIGQIEKVLSGDQPLISPQKVPDEIKTAKSSMELTTSQTAVFSRSGLSSREIQIATLISEGLTDKEIAEKLNISVGTVATHNKKIFKKIGVHSRIELVNKVR